MTAYNLSAEQRCLLAECLRASVTGWLVTCPTAGQQCRQFQARATLGALFSFSRFATLVRYRFGAGYRPRCPGTGSAFPLSVEEAIVIANDLELGFATDDAVYAAAAVAAHSPCAQPALLNLKHCCENR
jgi:hypothetical protein